MKKQYVMPSIECCEVTMAQVLCTSDPMHTPLIPTGPGSTMDPVDIG